jgi:5-methyltetrahydrofolate--homocysteine methyltransferase
MTTGEVDMDLLAALRERTLLLDGAMGTELISRGFRPGGPPEEWNASRPGDVAEIHAAYYAAGSDIVQTNTFGGSRHKLEAYGAAGRVTALNEAAAKLAVALRDRDYPGRLVAGDIGPTGTFVAPLGDADPDDLRDGFEEQAAALVAGGVDLIHVETMFDLVEARLAVEGVRRVAPELPLMVSLAYKPSPRGYRTMMGVDPQRAADTLLAAGATLVGCNCEITAEPMGALVEELREASGRPVVAQPNAGAPRLEDGFTVYDETAEQFAGVVAGFPGHGAGIVGGCCGTTPAFIAALAAKLGR